MDTTTDNISIQYPQIVSDLTSLFNALINDIDDDDRIDTMYIEPDDEPGLTVTVATNDAISVWNYQTGDNSYQGGAYGLPHWAVLYIRRDSVAADLIAETFDQWEELIAQQQQ